MPDPLVFPPISDAERRRCAILGRKPTEDDLDNADFVERLTQGGHNKTVALILASVTEFMSNCAYRVIRSALMDLVGENVKVTLSSLQGKAVMLEVLPPVPLVAPVCSNEAQQTFANAEVDRRNLAAEVAAAALPRFSYRPLMQPLGDLNLERGLDQFIANVVDLVPAGIAADDKWGRAIGDEGNPATEAEFRSQLRAFLEACMACNSGRLASWERTFDTTQAKIQAYSDSLAPRVQISASTTKTLSDEDVVQMVTEFQEDPAYLGWKVPLHFLLRKRDVQGLMSIVSMKKLPVSANWLPGKTKPFTDLFGTAHQYTAEMVHKRDSNGVVSLGEAEDVKETRVLSNMEIYSQTRMWIYTIMVIARGLKLGSELWVSPPAVLAWLEMLTVVSQVPSVGPKGFTEYRDTSISKMTRMVNTQIKTLDAALLEEVSEMESNCATLRQQQALLSAHVDGSPRRDSAVSGPCSNTECRKKIKSLEQQLSSSKNIADNKAKLLKAWEFKHGGPLTPADISAALSAGKSGGGGGSGGSPSKKFKYKKK